MEYSSIELFISYMKRLQNDLLLSRSIAEIVDNLFTYV